METAGDDTVNENVDAGNEDDDGGLAGFGVEQVFRVKSNGLGDLVAGGGSEMS